MHSFFASLRLSGLTLLVCVAGYTGVVLIVAQRFFPASAEGSLILASDGHVQGSRLIAQKFAAARYFWPRPSAVDYNATGAGGSNKSPTSADLTSRARQEVARSGATDEKPLPAELAAASGAGLDPHLTESAALYQVARVAQARGVPAGRIAELVRRQAFSPGRPFIPDRLINVLELNLALDAQRQTARAASVSR